MKNVIKLPKNGALLFLVLASLSACRESQPPIIDPICTLDGFGGGDCVTGAGERKYLSPSEMKNFWATSQPSMANFSSWCYDAPIEVVLKQMSVIESKAKAP